MTSSSSEGFVVWKFHNLKKRAKELGFALQYDTEGFALKHVYIGADGFPDQLVGYSKSLEQVEGFLVGLETAYKYPETRKVPK